MKTVKIKNKTLTVPIIQGGMGVGISLGNLAGNVAKCGGMGVISTAHPGYREDDFETNHRQANIRALKKEIIKAKEIREGKGIVAINAMVALQDYEELIEAAIEAGVEAIISGAGLPMHLPALVKNHDVLIAPIVSSGKACKLILRSWWHKHQRLPDFIVIEGCQAGGHLGFKKEDLVNHTCQSLDEIFRDVKQVVVGYEDEHDVKIPIFVAGGIYKKQDVDHYLSIGVDGVQVATRFITTQECDASIEYKKAFIEAKKEDIELVSSPVGMPGRAIKNQFTNRVKEGKINISKCYRCLKPCHVKDAPYCISKALIEAVKGNIDDGLIFSGAYGYLNNEMTTVKAVIEELTEEKS